jgi:hypothetical protein
LHGAKICPQASGPLLPRSLGAYPQAGTGSGGRGGGPGGAGGDGQERVGEHRQGHVAVPGAVLADLVVVQAGRVLGLGEAVSIGHPLVPATAASLGTIAGDAE